MTDQPLKIVIVGAGLVGLSTADAMLARGCEVTILEARSGPVRGTSFSNSGMIHPSQARPWGVQGDLRSDHIDALTADIRDLATQSRVALTARMEALSLDAALLRAEGCFQMFESAMDRDAAIINYAKDGVAAKTHEDHPTIFDRPAVYFNEDRSADARTYGLALARAVQAAGGTLIYEAQPIFITKGECEGVPSISLGSHTFPADHIIIAAGAQTPDLLAPLGLSCPITPVRGWAADFSWPDNVARAEFPAVPVMDTASRSAFTPFADRFRLSGTWDEDSIEPLLRRWATIAPSLMRAVSAPLSVWSGLRPVCALGRPIISETPIKGLWVNSGHGHLGWTLCTASGSLMADMIVDGTDDDRFLYPGLKDDASDATA